MTIPKWLLPIIASAVIGLLSSAAVWAWSSNSKIESNGARADYINSSLIDTKGYMSNQFDVVDKRFDKIESTLEKMNEKMDRINDKIK